MANSFIHSQLQHYISVSSQEPKNRKSTPAVYTRGDDTKVTNGGATEQTALLGNGQTTYSNGHFGVAENPNTDGLDFCGQNAHEDEARKVGLFGDPLTDKLSSMEQIMFWLTTIFLCIHMLRINFFIQSAHAQLLFYIADPRLTDSLTKAFTYLLPLGGLSGIPFVGFLLDKRSNRDAILVLPLFGAVFGALGMTSTIAPQIISIATLTILRPLMYTAVSDFSAKALGFQTFGTGYLN